MVPQQLPLGMLTMKARQWAARMDWPQASFRPDKPAGRSQCCCKKSWSYPADVDLLEGNKGTKVMGCAGKGQGQMYMHLQWKMLQAGPERGLRVALHLGWMGLLPQLHAPLADHAIDKPVETGHGSIELHIDGRGHPLWNHHAGRPPLGEVVKCSFDSLCKHHQHCCS